MTIDAVFIVNGLGLGNSTRCHAVMERLHQQGAKVHVVTSGNGIWYFGRMGSIDSVTEISSLYYSKKNGKISIANTLASVADFARILQRNAKAISSVLDKVEPNIVISDSEYSFWPSRRRNIPHVALNNSDVVVSAYRTFDRIPSSIRAQYQFVEFNDYLFNKTIPAFSISPTLDRKIPEISPRFRRVGPIVRKAYVPSSCGTPSRIVITLSGSAFGSQVILNQPKYAMKIDVIGRDAPDGWHGQNGVTYHGKITDTLPLLEKADLAVVNGGFSAVSEAFYMRKPLVVVPVPRHAEQWVNAQTIERLGVGIAVSEDDIENGMLRAFDRLDEFHAAYDAIGKIPDGASQTADLIMERAI
jgi:UDP:flavonoid glycosyltransferase YjiC (YdhE family)